ncbi:MAG: hypothetical protein CMN76_18840 [Spirochaetaceae bacterium]|nr:hypothetical protein [Spirochaetaceae bacterium]
MGTRAGESGRFFERQGSLQELVMMGCQQPVQAIRVLLSNLEHLIFQGILSHCGLFGRTLPL